MVTTIGDYKVLSAEEAAGAALRHISRLVTGNGGRVTAVEPVEDGWVVEVEVVEQPRIALDLLALYEVELDLDGVLLAYHRTRRYPRGSTDVEDD